MFRLSIVIFFTRNVCVVLLALLGSSHLASAQACRDSLRNPGKESKKIGNWLTVKQLPRRSFSNELLIDGRKVDTKVFDEFLRNPRKDGSVPIPANVILRSIISEPIYPNKYFTEFTTGAISAQVKSMRNFLRNLKERARTHSVDGEVEFGATIIDYDDGTSEVIRYTSDSPDRISGSAKISAFSKTSLMQGKVVRKILTIHTHPFLARADITPSAGDYLYLNYLSQHFQWADQPKVVGIVLPTAPATHDLFFKYDISGFRWVH